MVSLIVSAGSSGIPLDCLTIRGAQNLLFVPLVGCPAGLIALQNTGIFHSKNGINECDQKGRGLLQDIARE